MRKGEIDCYKFKFSLSYMLSSANYLSLASSKKLPNGKESSCLTNSHTMIPFDAPGKEAF